MLLFLSLPAGAQDAAPPAAAVTRRADFPEPAALWEAEQLVIEPGEDWQVGYTDGSPMNSAELLNALRSPALDSEFRRRQDSALAFAIVPAALGSVAVPVGRDLLLSSLASGATGFTTSTTYATPGGGAAQRTRVWLGPGAVGAGLLVSGLALEGVAVWVLTQRHQRARDPSVWIDSAEIEQHVEAYNAQLAAELGME